MPTSVIVTLQKKHRKQNVEEFVRNYLKDALLANVDLSFTPLGARMVIYSMRPGLVIGSKGRVIKNLQKELEERFGLENIQISVSEIELPELNPSLMAQRIASAISSGVKWRRVAFWALRRIVDAGARGAEVVISGKLTSARSKSEKYSAGILPKSGEFAMKYVKVGIADVKLPTGVFGVKVRIYPPDAPLPEEVKVREEASGQ
ncbi:MAG: 30S ribosomal protein S3 [Aigarchaeota archaeon]|nr:30S ribosomal protein S3 [Aigarchaeota archaeon]MDW8092201.1 30S ribosomal protein S3 [Nitrososphaerota archaeon]